MNPSIPDSIRNQHNESLEFTYHPGAADCSTLVILGHGVTGNKDRPLLIELANTLAQSGIHALRVSFAGNGGSEGRFADCTVSKEVDDLGAVLDALPGWQLGYVGHSMGAAVGVLRASQDPRIRFLVSLAGMTHTSAFAQREFGDVTPDAGCMWDQPECPLSRQFMDNMEQVHDVVEAARRVHVPWLWVHGLADDVVPPQDSRDLYAIAGPSRQLIELADADHVFSAPHTTTMAHAVTDWIGQIASSQST